MGQQAEKKEYEKVWCKVVLDEKELTEIATKLALKTQEQEEGASEKKSVVANFKEREERVGAEIKRAARLYKDGYEMRDVECEVERNFDTGKVIYRRVDTGEVAQQRDMTMGERQRRIEDALPADDAQRVMRKLRAKMRCARRWSLKPLQ